MKTALKKNRQRFTFSQCKLFKDTNKRLSTLYNIGVKLRSVGYC